MESDPGLPAPSPATNPQVLRRFTGPLADELVLHCLPDEDVQEQASRIESVYRRLAGLLASHAAGFGDVSSEILFLRNIDDDLPRVLEVRERVLAELGQSQFAPLPSFIGQPPLDAPAEFGLLAHAVIPHRREDGAVRDLRAEPACSCRACVRSGGRVIRLGEQTTLESSNLYGAGTSAYEQVWHMFCAAERLLEQCGMDFRDVSRTWIHLRDIDRDYAELNRARRDFFRERGIELRPASTGVQGAPFTEAHDFSLRIRAVRSSPPIAIARMSTPSLNEAWSYGADFSRGLRLAEANKVSLHISGTASIDESGLTVHVGDFAAQADRMIDNIELLLARQGASFRDLVSGIAYLKHPADAPALRAKFEQRGLRGFPCPIVDAPLCRPELLCEVEALAQLPFPSSGV